MSGNDEETMREIERHLRYALAAEMSVNDALRAAIERTDRELTRLRQEIRTIVARLDTTGVLDEESGRDLIRLQEEVESIMRRQIAQTARMEAAVARATTTAALSRATADSARGAAVSNNNFI
jgi:hypothetical protein